MATEATLKPQPIAKNLNEMDGIEFAHVAQFRKPAKSCVVAVSGGFDPLHGGHIDYIRAARKLGTKLIVILNTDAWLKRKKGYVFQPLHERAKILMDNRNVNELYVAEEDADGSIAPSLEHLKPDVFAKGGDRNFANIPKAEVEVCQRLGIRMEFGVGGAKTQSSSELVEKARNAARKLHSGCHLL